MATHLLPQNNEHSQADERLNAMWGDVERAYEEAAEAFERFLALKAAFVREFTGAENVQ